MWYVYEHIRLDTNQPFYIGIGNHRKGTFFKTIYFRAFQESKGKRTNFWRNIKNKTEIKINILYDNLTQQEAENKEIELINLYGRRALDPNGLLVNFSEGGNIRNSKAKNRFNIILQKDKITNQIIKEWNFLDDIVKVFPKSKSSIVACCKGRRITAYNFKWEYKNKPLLKLPSARIKNNTNINIGIEVYNEKGEFLSVFRTTKEVENFTFIKSSIITDSIRKKRSVNGFIFKYCKNKNSELLLKDLLLEEVFFYHKTILRNKETNELFFSVKNASDSLNIKEETLYCQIKRKSKICKFDLLKYNKKIIHY